MNKKLIFSKKYFEDIINVIKYLDHNNLEKLVDILVRVKKKQRENFLSWSWWKRRKLFTCCK